MNKDYSLLETLAESLACSYISDLSINIDLSSIQTTATKIASHSYSLNEWSDAIEYIAHRKRAFSSVEDAKYYLVNYIPSC